ncbi:MAG: hypothetical protein V2I33_17600 [Kangiellaceae bacterium]|nr:hypothetical protein [Kangiellaceae bacterium]
MEKSRLDYRPQTALSEHAAPYPMERPRTIADGVVNEVVASMTAPSPCPYAQR